MEEKILNDLRQEAETNKETYLMAGGEKITDPQEIVKYVEENMMENETEEIDPEEKEWEAMDEQQKRSKALEGLNLK